ncbi:hypothetical protein CEXT_392161 [Caerostris extrusa]|uniref:Uncharacterized protein n=1 Tax=Caerostris extrusa TaxID=172846 RepID=A0AAV4P1B2_CAEEX|nr:hypothetical protein CEXT_392161 [Caerostris extrusa]
MPALLRVTKENSFSVGMVFVSSIIISFRRNTRSDWHCDWRCELLRLLPPPHCTMKGMTPRSFLGSEL